MQTIQTTQTNSYEGSQVLTNLLTFEQESVKAKEDKFTEILAAKEECGEPGQKKLNDEIAEATTLLAAK